MALPVQQQVKIWGIAAAVFFLALWFLGDVLMPFILGGAIAYLLDPLADRLEARGLSRGAATAVAVPSSRATSRVDSGPSRAPARAASSSTPTRSASTRSVFAAVWIGRRPFPVATAAPSTYDRTIVGKGARSP